MSLTVNSILVQEAGLPATEVDGCVVILSLSAGSYFDFNKIASEIWRLLSKPCRVEEILQSLSRHHDVDLGILTRDVMNFLQTLSEQRLVRTLAAEEVQ